jgi:4-amino-4-deoxy-L-arabinose transferase-like glycosyltransferase
VATGRFRAILAAILLAAAALRFLGITHGLDLSDPRFSIWYNQNDEETQALAVRASLIAGDELPPEAAPGPFWLWGAGGFYAYRALDHLVLPLVSRITGLDVSPDGLRDDLTAVLLSHRAIGIAAALVAIALLARTTRREFDARTATVAAFFLATAYLSVRESHYGTLDPWLLLGAVVAIDRAFALARGPTPRSLAVAGFLIGIFASFKYSGAALVGPLVLGAFFGRGSSFAPSGLARLACDAIVLLIAAAAGYLLASPTFFSDFDTVVAMFRSQQGLIGFRLEQLPAMIAFHARASIGVGFGEPAVIAAAAGAVVALARPESRSRGGFLLLLLLALAALPLSNTSRSVRQALPMLPALAILAAIGTTAIAARARAPVSLVAVILCLPSLVRGVTFGLVAGRTDTRAEVMAYLADSGVPRDDVVGIGFYGLPRRSGVAAAGPFVDWLDAVHRRKAIARERAADWRPRFVIRDLCSGVDDRWGWNDWAPIVEREYREVLRVDGRKDGATPSLPDLEHGTPFHFVPYLDPWRMSRPGPGIVVYERVAPG